MAGPTTSADDGGPRLVTIEGAVDLPQGPAVVEVLVVVEPGEDADRVARKALSSVAPEAVEIDDEGDAGAAGGLQSNAFSTTGLVWDSMPVVVNYNAAGSPVADGLSPLVASLQTWTDVATSSFVYQYGGTTTRCPSLYDGCPGAQVFDGFNDVGWDDIPTSGVLGVTWSSSSIDEMDIVIDNVYSWHTGGLPVPFGKFDLETVDLHELGHGLGLGHSTVGAAVMAPSVSSGTAKRVPHQDDIDGISFLYPGSSPTATPTSTATDTPTSTDTPTDTPTSTDTPTATATATATAVDTTPPSASITSPADGATVSGTVTITADAADASGIHKVRFWAGSQYLGYDAVAPYSKTWDSTTVGNGAQALTIQALDWADNSTFRSVDVDVANGGGSAGSSELSSSGRHDLIEWFLARARASTFH